MLNLKFETELHQFLIDFPDVIADPAILPDYLVYRLDDTVFPIDNPNQLILAVVKINSSPLQIDLACDRLLSKTLRERYESVMGSSLMNSKTWNHIIATDELTKTEIFDLARLSYNLTLKFTQDLGL